MTSWYHPSILVGMVSRRFNFGVILLFGLWLTACQTVSSTAPLMDPSDPLWQTAAPAEFRARFETTRGEFVIRVEREWAPIGVDRFYHLVRAGFFDDSRFFRVIEGFIVQFGIPGDPAVSAVWRNRQMADDPVGASNDKGRIAYAMTGPDTRTTQLYISLTDNSRLDADGFAPIGEVESGMEVVEKIYSGYGEEAGGGMRRGNQDRMFQEGNQHLDQDSPKLDRILRVAIVGQ